MSDKSCGTNGTMLFACSGGSNVAQIANDAAKALDRAGKGRMYCAIGVASRLPTFIETANKADVRVALDGCEAHCLKKGFEAAGVSVDVHVVVTDLGIEKGHHFDYTPEEVARVADAVASALGAQRHLSAGGSGGGAYPRDP